MKREPIVPLRLYTVPQAADALGLSQAYVRQLIKTGEIKAKKIRPNAHPRISGQTILNMAEKGTVR